MTTRFLTTLLAILALTVIGCAEDGDVALPPNTALEVPGFEGLPVPDGAQVIAPVAELDGVYTETIEVAGMTPEDAIAFYENSLDQRWSLVIEPAAVGLGEDVQAGSAARVYQAGWTTGEHDLLVAAREGDNLQDAYIDLVLGPPDSGVFDVDAVR